jgi:hypothetical protein
MAGGWTSGGCLSAPDPVDPNLRRHCDETAKVMAVAIPRGAN